MYCSVTTICHFFIYSIIIIIIIIIILFIFFLNDFLASSRSSPHSKSNDVIYSVQLDRAGQSLGISLQGGNLEWRPV